MHAQLVAAVLGLVATGCDIAITRRDELLYMWKKPLRITSIRCLFVFTRYLPIAIHIIDVVFIGMWVDGTEQVPAKVYCMRVLISRYLACYSMVVLLELALMLRVFALYDRSRAIGAFLLFLLISRIAGAVYHIMQRVLQSDAIKINFNNECIPVFTQFNHALSNPVVVFISSALTIQLLILALILKRTIWDFRQYSHLLFSVLKRDGLIIFGAMGVAMIAIGVGSAKKGAAVFIFPLFISLISAVGCHTILNLQKLGSAGADANLSEQKKELELTSFNAMNITTWDERTFQMVDYLPNALENEIVTMHPVPPATV
ncbi:hypothetical protein BDP27DRAFT_591090 [Rhodocollybia butyracea]|uniref:DUF6533 domain-containing protein n=1 Tax=Rhodocollybia butyracea TaxID=206335 RepID=A0A9P5PYQ6_9AGAR|nr:hypothetical protein BDP27DRAFT_591090 [Rhodocollybia butyracea]